MIFSQVNLSKDLAAKNLLPESYLLATRQLFSPFEISSVVLDLGELTSGTSLKKRYLESLSGAEHSRLSSFSLFKRKVEWLGGRLCAKLSWLKLFHTGPWPELKTIHIDNAESGRPFILHLESNGERGIMDLSISHGGGFACALVANSYCGIDIQEQKDTLINIYDRFCTAQEEKIICEAAHDVEQMGYLTLLWSAKEAVRKACSHSFLPGFLEIILTEATPCSQHFSLTFTAGHLTAKVICTFFNSHGLAVCLLQD